MLVSHTVCSIEKGSGYNRQEYAQLVDLYNIIIMITTTQIQSKSRTWLIISYRENQEMLFIDKTALDADSLFKTLTTVSFLKFRRWQTAHISRYIFFWEIFHQSLARNNNTKQWFIIIIINLIYMTQYVTNGQYCH